MSFFSNDDIFSSFCPSHYTSLCQLLVSSLSTDTNKQLLKQSIHVYLGTLFFQVIGSGSCNAVVNPLNIEVTTIGRILLATANARLSEKVSNIKTLLITAVIHTT